MVRSTTCHPTAEWVYEQIRRIMPHISLGTVYRNLRLLKDEGVIQELRFNGSQSRFDGNSSSHAHFICEKCNQIFDVDDQMGAEIKYDKVSRNGLKVVRHTVTYFGLCRDCPKDTYKYFKGLMGRLTENRAI
ncbi:transcriptional repressor [Chloroflexota bacterium]